MSQAEYKKLQQDLARMNERVADEKEPPPELLEK